MSRDKVYSGADRIPSGKAGHELTQGCLVLEGGAFRGVYTQGVLDTFMQKGLNFQTVIGVSAGALGGMNYVAGQIGRSARANLLYRHDHRYIGGKALLRSGSILNLQFLLTDFNAIEPLDIDRLFDPERKFVSVVTCLETGETEYMDKDNCPDIMAAIQASASMPYISPAVSIGERHYLDGGCSCRIAYQWALDQEYEKIVVIKTRERGYRKRLKKRTKYTSGLYRKYPEFAAALKGSSAVYNGQCDEIDELEQQGRIFVIAPGEPVQVSRMEGDMDKLGALYEEGRREGEECFDALMEYLRS